MKKPLLIKTIESIKKNLNINTYIIEYFFVAFVLISVAIISNKGGIEWVGVAAVFLTFGHASIAERLREREEIRKMKKDPVEVNCYYKLPYYFYLKEICWFIYFIYLGAYSALCGVILFLAYDPWRKYYRKYHPIKN
jgi:hypothetical protein